MKTRYLKIVLIILTAGFVFGGLEIARAANFEKGDTVKVDRTAGTNVRVCASTSCLEIDDIDYLEEAPSVSDGYAPYGAQGKVLADPISNNGYVWWKVEFGSLNKTSKGDGKYTGWTIENNLKKVSSALVPPTNLKAIGDSNTVLMNWDDKSTNETGFKIERKEGTSGTYILIKTTNPNVKIYQDSSLEFGKTYCYRVRAYNAAENTAPSKESCITTLATPVLSYPNNNAVVDKNSVTLKWNNVVRANGYAVNIGKNCGGTEIIDAETKGVTINHEMEITDLANGTYYWQVRAFNGTYSGLSDFSTCRNFKIDILPSDIIPPTVVNTIPANGEFAAPITNTITVIFSENIQPGNLSVLVVADKDNNPVPIETVAVNGKILTISLKSILNYETGYAVGINAGAVKDLAGNPNSEYPWAFITKALEVLPPPVLISPVNDSIGISVTPILKWNSVDNAQGYTVQVSKGSNFNTIAFSTVVNTTSIQVTLDLMENTKYFWRVFTFNSQGKPGSWSKVWSFNAIDSSSGSGGGGESGWSCTQDSDCLNGYCSDKKICLLIDGSLIGGMGTSKVYLIENGQKRWIVDPRIFVCWGYQWKDIIHVSDDELNNYPTGENIQDIPSTMVIVTIDKLITNDVTPQLTGTISDNDAIITVTVAENKYSAINNENGTWFLPDNIINELRIGIYDVEVRAIKDNYYQIEEYDNTRNELTIKSDEENPPFAVAIDNQKNARPVSGVDEADIVYEFPVEGSITRFMAIYNPDSGIDPSTQIGPVRSARPYFARTASEHRAIYAHAGGIPDALWGLSNHRYSVYNLDALFTGYSYFWRDWSRSAPYNLYTSIENLNNFRDEFELGTGEFIQPWIFSDTPSSMEDMGYDQDVVEIEYTNQNYNVKWIYDYTDGVYYRQTYEDGNYQDYIDINDNHISTVNLAIQYANTDPFTEIIQTEGTALLCREGKCVNGQWRKDSLDSNIIFYLFSGEEFKFKTGKLWINVAKDITPPIDQYYVNAHSAHFPSGDYFVELMVDDPNQNIQSVSVAGLGIDGSIFLKQGIHPFYPNQWWSQPNVNLGSTPSSLPLVYTFTITDNTSSTYVINDSVESCLEDFATNLSPVDKQTDNSDFVFSWTGVENVEGIKYKIELYDESWNRIWDSSLITDTSFIYNGPVLALGDYQYFIAAFDKYGNESLAYGTFKVISPIENQSPNPPNKNNLWQLKSDSTEIEVGKITNEREVVFKARVSDPDGDRVKLQVELRNLNEYDGKFDENKEGLKARELVSSEETATVNFSGLIDEEYHWRARVIDEKGNKSGWVEFGENDISEADFIVQTLLEDAWVEIAQAPENISGGASVVFHNESLYITRGGGTSDFWRFDINSKSWTTLASLPDVISHGADMTLDGERYIYATKGTNWFGLIGNRNFWRYDLQKNEWEILPDTPEDVGAQGALCYADGLVYLRPGGDFSWDFYRYSPVSQNWEKKASGRSVSPGVGLAAGPECAMTYDGIQYIYTFQGGNNINGTQFDDIWRYNTWNDEWLEIGYDEEFKRADLVYVGGGLYALNRDTPFNFDYFDLTGAIWERKTELPSGGVLPSCIGIGASLTYNSKQHIYALEGNNQRSIWRYGKIYYPNHGYAIIVAGQGGWRERSAINYNANNAYRVLRNLGYDDEHIFYLNSNRPQNIDDDKDDEADAFSTVNNFTEAMLWAKQHITKNTPFILYLVGHGSRGKDDPELFFFKFNNNEYEFITPLNLDILLSLLPEETPKFILIDTCYSGIFITDSRGNISAPNRVIVTSAHDDQKKISGISGNLFYSEKFWRILNEGLNIKDTFIKTGDNYYSWLNDKKDPKGISPEFLIENFPKSQDDRGWLAGNMWIGIPGTENIKLKCFAAMEWFSPVNVQVCDSQGRITGFVDGEVIEEIPNSVYDEENKIVIIFDAKNKYDYKIIGADTGTYGLKITSNKTDKVVTFSATDISTTPGQIHEFTINWDKLSQDEEGVIMKIDIDGDGEFDKTITSDATLESSEITVDNYSSANNNGGSGGVFTISPTDTSIIINNKETASADVNLTLSASNAAQMAISNGLDFAGVSWEDYKISKEWALTSGVGEKTVYAKFRSSNGGVSSVVSDTIVLNSERKVKGAATIEIIDGDIIQCQSSDNPFAVYIVKIVGDTKYIRHIVSLEIFNYYGHLKWENLKQVDSLDNYSLSGWVRYNTGANGMAAPTDKVYEINGDQTKHWINMTAEQFLTHGGSEPAIFNINQGKLNLYIFGADVMSL